MRIENRESPGKGIGRVWIITAVCAAAVYLATMAPGLLWGDSGDAQVRVLAGALTDPRELVRTHVPYYATAMAVKRLFGLEAARAANLVSALAGAVTVANVGCLVWLLTRRRAAVVCGVALLLFSHTLWQLSAGAEVVTFSTMCLSLELLMLTRFAQTRRRPWLMAAGFANGIGWSTHNLAMLTWPAYLVVVALRWRKLPRPRGRLLAGCGLAWLIGAFPLLVLIGAEYERLGDVPATLRSLLVGVYGGQVFNTALCIGLVLRLFLYVTLNFPTPVILLSLWGWWRARGQPLRALWLFLTVAGGTFAAFGARYNVADQYTFLVHSYVFLVLFTALGVDWWLARHPSRDMAAALAAASVIAPLLYAAAPPLARRYGGDRFAQAAREVPYRDSYAWFLRPWRAGDRGAERYAREVFDCLPGDAILLCDSTIQPAMAYVQGSSRVRLDVALPMTSQPLPWGPVVRIDSEKGAQWAAKGLLFCTTPVRHYVPDWVLDGGYGFEPFGLVYRVRRPEAPTDRTP